MRRPQSLGSYIKEVNEITEKKQNPKVAKKVNKHQKPMLFKEEDLVCVHLWKEGFQL